MGHGGRESSSHPGLARSLSRGPQRRGLASYSRSGSSSRKLSLTCLGRRQRSTTTCSAALLLHAWCHLSLDPALGRRGKVGGLGGMPDGTTRIR
jgi:hypothetical protein